jgi:hypothetical protein
MRVAEKISLSTPERRKLERVAKSRASGARLIERAQIALLADRGLNNVAIAEQLGSNVTKVGRWRKRFALHGFTGIERDAYRPGRIPALDPKIVEAVVEKTTYRQALHIGLRRGWPKRSALASQAFCGYGGVTD